MTCGKKTSQVALVITNSFFLMAGLGLIGCGIWIRIASKDYDTVLGSKGLETPANLVLAVGGGIFLVSFLGLCGACKANKCFLLIYLAFLISIIVVEIGSVAVAFVFKDKVKEHVTSAVTKAVTETYGKKGHEPITFAIDSVQKEMKCCGANGASDYVNTTWYKEAIQSRKESPFPDSCIDQSKRNFTQPMNSTTTTPFNEGCISKMQEAASEQLLLSGALAATILFIEILGMFAGISLFKNLRAAAMPI